MGKNLKILLVMLIVTCTLIPLVSTNFTIYADEAVTNAEMMDMAVRATGFIESMGTIPNYVYTTADQTNFVTAAEFYYMMARWLRWYKNNNVAPNTVSIVRNIAGPPNPSGVASGTIYQADILAKGQSNADFIDTNLYVPNFTTVGAINYLPTAFYSVMARTIRWYKENSVLPNYATVVAVDPPTTWTYDPLPQPTPTPEPYPWSKTLSVAHTYQPDGYTCGPTSLRMVMGYYGTWRTVTEISNYMAGIGDSPYYDGVAPSIIVSAGKYYGFSATTEKFGLVELKDAIQNNHPVIGHLQITGGGNPKYYPSGLPMYSSYTGGHYVVVRGLKADANGNVLYVIVNEPTKGEEVKITWSSFDSAWAIKSRRIIKLR